MLFGRMATGDPNQITITGRYGTQVSLRIEAESPTYNLGEGRAWGSIRIIADDMDAALAETQQKKDLLTGVATGNSYSSGSILGQLGYKVSRHFNVAPLIQPVAAARGDAAYRISMEIPDGSTVAEFTAAVRQGLNRIRAEMNPDNKKRYPG